MTAHPHRGKRGLAKKQWEAAASAASLIYRAMDARTWTAGADLFDRAEERLIEAGLFELADRASVIRDNFGMFADEEVRELQDAVAEAAGKLETAYLEMTP